MAEERLVGGAALRRVLLYSVRLVVVVAAEERRCARSSVGVLQLLKRSV